MGCRRKIGRWRGGEVSWQQSNMVHAIDHILVLCAEVWEHNVHEVVRISLLDVGLWAGEHVGWGMCGLGNIKYTHIWACIAPGCHCQ